MREKRERKKREKRDTHHIEKSQNFFWAPHSDFFAPDETLEESGGE